MLKLVILISYCDVNVLPIILLTSVNFVFLNVLVLMEVLERGNYDKEKVENMIDQRHRKNYLSNRIIDNTTDLRTMFG